MSGLVKIVLQDLGNALIWGYPSWRLHGIDGVPSYRCAALLLHVAVVHMVEDLLKGDAHHPRRAERYVDDVRKTICGLDHVARDSRPRELLNLLDHEPCALDDPLRTVERRDLWMLQA